jgi:branched-subunit amino acid aminotransferase/4-amino-4-deoxychorismate lyase
MVMDLTLIGKDKFIETLLSQRKPWYKNYLIIGTSINVVPVTKFDGRRIGTGLPGPVFSKLSTLVEKDIRENQNLLTGPDWGG